MKRLALSISASLLFLAPVCAFAHEHRQYTVGDKQYNITIGSLNEPVSVDDKSGVELTVQELGADAVAHDDGDGDDDGPAGTPVLGLEQTLKVELIAGDKKKTLDFTPLWGEPGSYQAVFYPTVQTTYTYRVFGMLNNVTIDMSFECNPAGHPQTEDDRTPQTLSDGVTQTMKGGAFGCPGPKVDKGFPEPSANIAETLATARMSAANGKRGQVLGIASLALSAIALGIATRKRKA